MKKLFYLLILFLSLTQPSLSQDQPNDELIISDSLFNAPSMDWYFKIAPCNDETNINDIFTIEDDYLKFRIHYGCGCGTILTYYLVTDRVLHLDNSGKIYYNIKLYFYTDNTCKAGCHANLSYNISKLKSKDLVYLKFDGCDKFIPYK